MSLLATLAFFGIGSLACAEPDEALRQLLGVSSLRMTMPKVAGGYEAALFILENGQKKRNPSTLDVKPGAEVELAWRAEGAKTMFAIVSQGSSTAMWMMGTFTGDVGWDSDKEDPMELGDGWRVGRYSAYAKVTTMPGSISFDPLPKLMTMPNRRVVILAYRPKQATPVKR